MKLSLLKTASGMAALALAPAISFAAGLAGTDHDFTGLAGNLQTIGLCTYCHTPHKAKLTTLLWNHTLSGSTFSWDVPKTTAGTEYPNTLSGTTYKGPTTKCLSCHDGTVAIGDVGWFDYDTNPAGGVLNPSTMLTLSPDGSHVIGAGVNGMKGNHPVAMPYPYNNERNTYNGKRTGANAVLTEWQADPSTLATAYIRLFNDDGNGNITAGVATQATGIECSSCHDPHNKAIAPGAPYFLRGQLTGTRVGDGYLCLQCHIK